jgi:hypothetical protein
MLLSSFVMMIINHVVLCTEDTWCTAKFSCDWVVMEYTHDKYCDMLLTLSVCNGQTGTDTQEYTLCYLDTNVLWLLQQHLCQTCSVAPVAYVNAGHPWTVWTPANEDTIIAAMERELWRSSHDLSWQLGLSQLRVLEVLIHDQFDSYHFLQDTHLLLDYHNLHLFFV